jgi:hypothetical protein
MDNVRLGTVAALKHRGMWIVFGIGFILLVIHLSLTSQPVDVPGWWNFKLGHIVAYCWLMLWFAQIYARFGVRLAIAAALLAMGIGLEYVQGLVGRDFSYSDMRDDGIGIALGWGIALTPFGKVLKKIDA